MFTTEPSRRAMLDPTTVATSVSHLRFCDRTASKAGVVSMTPASHGGRVNPTIGYSRRAVIVGQRAPGTYPLATCRPPPRGTIAFRSVLKCRHLARLRQAFGQ